MDRGLDRVSIGVVPVGKDFAMNKRFIAVLLGASIMVPAVPAMAQQQEDVAVRDGSGSRTVPVQWNGGGRGEGRRGGEGRGGEGRGGGWQGRSAAPAQAAPQASPQAAPQRWQGGDRGGNWQGRGGAQPGGRPVDPRQGWQGNVRGQDRAPDRDATGAGASGSRWPARDGVVSGGRWNQPQAQPGDTGREPRNNWRDNDSGRDRDRAARDWNRDGRVDGRDWNRDGRNWDRDGRGRDWNDGRRGNDWRTDQWRGGRRLDEGERWREQRRWSNNWRNDRRYDWRWYRDRNRSAYRLPSYYAPYGWNYGYRRFSIGIFLNSILFSNQYWIDDPWDYRLPPSYGTLRWIRYYDDALLVDIRDGYVVDVIYDMFW